MKFGSQINRYLLYMSVHCCLQTAGTDMVVSMLQLLPLTAVTQDAVALTDSMLTPNLLERVLCLWTIAHRPFAPGKLRDVSLPRTTPTSPAVL